MPLYKYMTAQVAPLFSKSLKVRFTQPADLDDPFEFRPLIDFEATAVENRGKVEAKITELFGTVDPSDDGETTAHRPQLPQAGGSN